MEKLTIHDQVAKRDAEENGKLKKCRAKKAPGVKKEHHHLFGDMTKDVSREDWLKHLSTFGTPAYSGPIIKADGKTVMVNEGKEISNNSEEPKA